MLALLMPYALGACPAPVPEEDLLRSLSAAESAFAQGDAPSFACVVGQARAELPCLDAPASPELVAAWHQSRALEEIAHYDPSDTPNVVAELRAALAAKPDYALPAELAEEGSLLPPLLMRARAQAASPTAPVVGPPSTVLLIDGATGGERPLDRPFLLQVEREGQILYTAELAAGQPAPDWETLGFLPPTKARRRLGRTPTLALLGGGFVLTGVGGLSYGAALANLSDWRAQDAPPEQVPELIHRSHVLTATALVSGLVGVGAGALALGYGQL